MISYTGRIFTSTTFEGRFIETGVGGVFNLAKTMVTVFPKELVKYKEEKHKYEKLKVMKLRINNKSELRIPVGK